MILKLTLWAMEHQIAHTVDNVNDVINFGMCTIWLLIGTKIL